MSTTEYRESSGWKRWNYFLSRHWVTILLGYATVFLAGMCLRPFFLNPKRHWDGAVAAGLHATLLTGAWWYDPTIALLVIVMPLSIACGLGSYLFFAQHNFPECQLFDRGDWSHAKAAMSSSSFIRMSPWMHWFTGNIGYHHVHHLNAKIPYYRLPEAMAALPELQSPGTTSLRPRDILACLRLNLWDSQRHQLVSYREGSSMTAPIRADQRPAEQAA
jgi:omega-6 fatty acid desaturase (delta-12 desaturase)